MQITKLKIDSNPFAKGFRDSSRLSDFERETMENMFESQFLRTQQVLKKKIFLKSRDYTSRRANRGLHN